jgi:hypothetical protein
MNGTGSSTSLTQRSMRHVKLISQRCMACSRLVAAALSQICHLRARGVGRGAAGAAVGAAVGAVVGAAVSAAGGKRGELGAGAARQRA